VAAAGSPAAGSPALEVHVLQYIDSAIGFAMIMLTVSLIIMVIMQAVSSLLDLRGRNLVWAMEQLFNQISPETKDKAIDETKSTFSGWTKLLRARFTKISVAEEIAHAIANHPALTANANSLATAIRPDEIRDVLQAIKDGKGRKPFEQLDDAVQQQIKALLQPVEDKRTDIQAVNSALSAIDQLVPAQAAQVKAIVNAAITAISTATIDRVMAEVKAQAADKAEAIETQVQEAIRNATALEQGLEKWFNAIMDHASTRFTKHNRFWTLIIAICLTLYFRVDSDQIFKQIFSNPELRATLVNAAEGATKQAEEILRRQHLGTQALQDLVAQGKLSEKTRANLLARLPADKDTCTEGAAYLAEMAPPATNEDQQQFLTFCEIKQRAILAGAHADVKQLTARLDAQELSVFNHVKWPYLDPDKTFGQLFSGLWVHLRGLILTVVLLSLGAPFWFDALKQMVSLRPTIAGKIDKEQGKA